MNSLNIITGSGRDILRQAWKALALHRLRSFLSVLGIVFAVAAVVTMLAIAEGAKKEAIEQIGRLGIDTIIIRHAEVKYAEPEGSATPVPDAPDVLGYRDLSVMRQIPGIEDITVVREANAFLAELGESDVVKTLAVDQNYPSVRGLRLSAGRFISDIDVQKSHQVCVLGAELARRIRSGAALGSTVHFDGDPFRVVGILRPRGRIDNDALPVTLHDFDNTAFIPLFGADKAAVIDSGLSEMILKISDSRTIKAVAGAVRHALLWRRNGVENFELIVPRELLVQARKTQRLFNIVLGSIAGISLLVGGIGIMNIMLANVSERTREIGIRRAIGASRQHIVIHFLGESILLTLMGGVLGIVLGALAALGVNLFIQWRATITVWPVLSALFMSLAVGMVSGIYPAIKAADMEPVAALRHI